MFTSRNSVLAADPPLYLPTIIATSDSFPALSEQLPISYNMKLNVHLYQSLDIRILLTDIGNSSCEEVYMLVSDSTILLQVLYISKTLNNLSETLSNLSGTQEY